MRVGILTNEYPPHIYGGAGVHVEHLTRGLVAAGADVHVLCFGGQHERSGALTVDGVRPPAEIPAQDPRHSKLFATLLQDLVMTGQLADVDVVHCHTWYTHLAGCLGKQLQNIPLVLTTHSLEPHRPWKAEQLGTAYAVSSWIERMAYENADGVVAVSDSMKRDTHELYGVPFTRIRVIHNGIDVKQFRPTADAAVLRRYGIDPERPYALFVGRITRQKGIVHLVRAIRYLTTDTQVVLCAGAPDTPDIAAEVSAAVELARAESPREIVWIHDMLPKSSLVPLYSGAAVFVCPSVYEPFGIINLEAMACATPVVGSAVGGIPEIVVDGETGVLVGFEPAGNTSGEPKDPDRFSRDLAAAIDRLIADPGLRLRMGRNARARVEKHFGWPSIARQTLDFYEELVSAHMRARRRQSRPARVESAADAKRRIPPR